MFKVIREKNSLSENANDVEEIVAQLRRQNYY